MTLARRLRVALAFALAAAMAAAAPALAAESSSPGAVAISMSRSGVSTALGDSFRFKSVVTNAGRTPLSGLVAHLNIVSWIQGVYVDPEDWSGQRTHYLPSLAPGGSVGVPWEVKSVNGGHFAVYVVVLPPRGPGSVPQSLAVGPDLDVRVTERKALDSGGVLVLSLGVPGLLGLALLGARARRRR